MKKYLVILILFVAALNLNSQQAKCERQTKFGSANICLPTLDGYNECFAYSGIQELLEMTSVPDNVELGFYLSNATYDQRDRLQEFEFDDYIKIYGTKALKEVDANPQFMKEAQKELSKYFLAKNWKDIHKEIDKIGIDIQIGTPTVVSKYSIRENSFTYIMFANYSSSNESPYIMAYSMSGIVLNKRLVWIAYYLNYEDEETMKELETKSNEIINRILDVNENHND